MHEIILLSSFHMETGKCNPKELYNIIENIQPEVIFEELPHDIFNAIYFKGIPPKSIEAKAIRKYKEKYQIKNLPVDTYNMDISQVFQGYDIISNRNKEYILILKEQLRLVGQYGYAFINSNEFAEMLDKLHKIEQNTLIEINDSKLSSQYEIYLDMNNNRDLEMLQNIYNHSKNIQYKKALFICGAEHRKSIIEKIPAFENKELFKLNWGFYNN